MNITPSFSCFLILAYPELRFLNLRPYTNVTLTKYLDTMFHAPEFMLPGEQYGFRTRTLADGLLCEVVGAPALVSTYNYGIYILPTQSGIAATYPIRVRCYALSS